MMNYEEEIERYKESLGDLQSAIEAAYSLSVKTHGTLVELRELAVASRLFAKLCLHAQAVFRIAPKKILTPEDASPEFWDLSSLAVLTRATVDTYYVLYYLAVECVSDDIRNFRFLLWDFHSEVRRLEMLKLVGSSSDELMSIQSEVERFRDQLTQDAIYLKQVTNTQAKLRRGEIGIFLTNSHLSERAGIDPGYYKSTYRFLSSYAHAHPFSINQLSQLTAGNEESLRLIKVVIDHCCAYLCLGIRDFVILFPDQADSLGLEVRRLIELWSGLLAEFATSRG